MHLLLSERAAWYPDTRVLKQGYWLPSALAVRVQAAAAAAAAAAAQGTQPAQAAATAEQNLIGDVQRAGFAFKWIGGKFDGCATDPMFLWLLVMQSDVDNITMRSCQIHGTALPIDMRAGLVFTSFATDAFFSRRMHVLEETCRARIVRRQLRLGSVGRDEPEDGLLPWTSRTKEEQNHILFETYRRYLLFEGPDVDWESGSSDDSDDDEPELHGAEGAFCTHRAHCSCGAISRHRLGYGFERSAPHDG